MKHSFYQMPKVTIPPDLSDEDRRIVSGIINTKTGELRASKPTTPRKIEIPSTRPDPIFKTNWVYQDQDGEIAGKTAYVWRMVAFYVSPHPQHQCMPVTADFDLPAINHQDRRNQAKELDILVDKVTNLIPKSQWHGVTRWAKAFGAIS